MVVGDVTTAVDVLVLGAGPGGYVAAIRAAQLGRHATLVDLGAPGGTCLKRGCIPLKALLSASKRYRQMFAGDLAGMGIAAESVTLNWSQMQAWKQGVVDRLTEGVHRLLSGNGVEYVQGMGWFINAQEARVEGEYGSHRFKFEHCIIATGAEAAPLPNLPYDGEQILTPEQALQLSELPASLSIFGNDYIALELAALFIRLGVGVSLYTPGEQLMPGIDAAALRLVQTGLRKMGIQVKTGADIVQIVDRPLVVSNGVQGRTSNLHLQDIGVQVGERGGIPVNAMQQSSVPHIYAVGDCAESSRATPGNYAESTRATASNYTESTGTTARDCPYPPLASTAIKQGKVAAESACGQRVQFAPLVIPLVVHTTPELATVGYSADAAAKAGYNVVSGRFPLAANGRALTLGADNGVALIVANADDGVILGATLVGPRAGDLIGQITLAIEMGATLTDLSEILYAHPGLSETILESAESALGKVIHIMGKA
jgi:dihydrolipoamide dehydrogenase